MNANIFYNAMRRYGYGGEYDKALRVCLYLAGGHKMTGIPQGEEHNVCVIVKTSDDGLDYDDENVEYVYLDVSDILALRVFFIEDRTLEEGETT